MRLLLAGDTHANLHHFKRLIATADAYQVHRIVVLGDFGYWPHVDNFHESVGHLADMHKIDVYWLDGNHENFDALEKAVKMDSAFPQQMSNHLFYLPRGMLWVLDDVKILILGGAISIDRGWRLDQENRRGKPGTLYWPQEATTFADVERAISRGKVDIMLTHDMPHECYGSQFGTSGYKADIGSERNRLRISTVMNKAKPKALFHGHMHTAYFEHIDGVSIRGLAHDNAPYNDSWYILDTDEYLDKDIVTTV